MSGNNKANRCKAIRSDGKPCRAHALKGGKYCFSHDTSRRASFLNASRRGGRSQQSAEIVPDDEYAVALRLHDPVSWGEHYLRKRDGSKRDYWPHQVEDLRCEDRNIIHLDGRDTGKCLPGSTLIVDCETGERVPLNHLIGDHRIPVLGPDLKITTTRDYALMENGPKECFRLHTQLGRSVDATANHPFLTEQGWLHLAQLRPGDWLAVPRTLPVEAPDRFVQTDDEMMMLAYLIARGGRSDRTVRFLHPDPEPVAAFRQVVGRLFPGTKVVRDGKHTYRVAIDRRRLKSRRNPCLDWAWSFGEIGNRNPEKTISGFVYAASRRQLALFLSELWGCDGWVHGRAQDNGAGPLTVGCHMASQDVAKGVAHLLLRFGILCRVQVKKSKAAERASVELASLDDVRRFARYIGLAGRQQGTLQTFLAKFDDRLEGAQDRIPGRIPATALAALPARKEAKMPSTEDDPLPTGNPTRQAVAVSAQQSGSVRLQHLAGSDIYWDRVERIEAIGVEETYDLSVPGYRNFIADDVIVHNSVALCTDVLHFAFTTRGGQGLVAAPHQGHLDSLIEEIEFQIETNEELSASIAVNEHGQPEIIRKPYFRIEFTNGAGIYFRPAGPRGDAFRSLHVERVWVDEGAWFSEKAWQAIRQCLKAKGILRIYSTPSGIRKSTYYRLTRSDTWKVFRWPSWLNPTWDAEREADLLEFYGGRDTAGWQHEVAGEHGKPSFGAFNIVDLNKSSVEIPEYVKIVITGDELSGCETEEEVFDRLEMLLNLVPQDGTFWIGGDLGYTNDPTEIVVFQETRDETRARARLVLRIHMEHVAYPHIAETIALLDRYYSPAGIGVDRGGNGLSVVQELTTMDKYRDLQLADRLHGYDFGGVTTIGYKNDQPLKKRTKEHMTNLINRSLQWSTLLLPAGDVEIEDQFTTQTYTMANGKVVYSKGNDHIVDAVRCAALVRDQQRLDELSEVIVPFVTPVMTDPIFP